MEREKIREGMTVRSLDGGKVGRIVLCKEEDFLIESGIIFTKDYNLRYDEVLGVDDEEVRVRYTLDQIKSNDFPMAPPAPAMGTGITSDPLFGTKSSLNDDK